MHITGVQLRRQRLSIDRLSYFGVLAMSEMRDKIMATARATVQQHGYNGLSFRELAKDVGIKSASIHYHFPTKGDLGSALARRYSEEAQALFDGFLLETPDPSSLFRNYTDVFRMALERNNRMCLCGIMGAEYDELPDAVKVEVSAFADVNVAWLTRVLTKLGLADGQSSAERAAAIYAAVIGAQLVARSRNDISLFDRAIETYRATGLIPQETTA
jgi:TetR/AcrR family transcriptional regulator, transcriptional repressor for nem operon